MNKVLYFGIMAGAAAIAAVATWVYAKDKFAKQASDDISEMKAYYKEKYESQPEEPKKEQPKIEAQKKAEETAQEIDAEHKERQSPFRFSMCNIQPGEEIEYCNNPEIKCTVVDDKTVSYQGQSYSLSSLAQLLTGSKYSVAGPRYFKYKGEWLNDIRHRLEG